MKTETPYVEFMDFGSASWFRVVMRNDETTFSTLAPFDSREEAERAMQDYLVLRKQFNVAT